jgi:hypothetical protein
MSCRLHLVRSWGASASALVACLATAPAIDRDTVQVTIPAPALHAAAH